MDSIARSRSAAFRACSAIYFRFAKIHARSTPISSTLRSRSQTIRARTCGSRASRAADAEAACRSSVPNARQYASVLFPQHSPAASRQNASRLRVRSGCAAGASCASLSKLRDALCKPGYKTSISIAAIGAEVRLSKPTIIRAQRQLLQAGCMTRVSGGGTSRKTAIFIMAMPKNYGKIQRQTRETGDWTL